MSIFFLFKTAFTTFICSTLLSFQMNVYYQSLKSATGGELDLYVIPSEVIMPEVSPEKVFS